MASKFFSTKYGKAKKGDPQQQDSIPWVEKYRPKSVDDVAYQDEVVNALKNTLKTGNLPHLLFYGPPGTGKTSTILAVARELFGPEVCKTRVLELNASDERGISVIREKVKSFAQTASSEGTWNNKNYPAFKIIVLDEADSMTADAQSALRRVIENYSRVTRFCIICNYVSRISEPIASRCAKFRFRPFDQSTMRARIQYVADQENLTCGEGVAQELERVSGGDLRRAITLLQSATRFYGLSIEKSHITEVAGLVPDNVVQSLLSTCQKNSFEQLQSTISEIIASGYSAAQVIATLTTLVIESESLDDQQKSTIAWKLTEADRALVDGSDEYLQLLSVSAAIMNEFCSR